MKGLISTTPASAVDNRKNTADRDKNCVTRHFPNASQITGSAAVSRNIAAAHEGIGGNTSTAAKRAPTNDAQTRLPRRQGICISRAVPQSSR